jgi:hypothetical protein
MALAVVVFLGVAPGNTSLAGGFDEAAFVRGCYLNYLNREPSAAELTEWVRNLRRGVSAADVQANFLGSNEYYARYGNNPNNFLAGLYQDVLGRAPDAAGVANWLNRLQVHRGDRVKVALEFLQAAQGELQQRPPSPPPASAAELANALVAASQSFVETVRGELAGTRQGRQLVLRGNALTEAAARLRQILATPGFAAPQAWQEQANVERAFQAVQAELANPAGTAPRASQIAQQLSVGIVNLRAALPPVTDPGASWPGLEIIPPHQQKELDRLVGGLSADVATLVNLLQPVGHSSAIYHRLLQATQGLSQQVQVFRGQLRPGVRPQEIRAAFQTVLQQAGQVSSILQQGTAFGQVQTTWYRIDQTLGRIGTLFGSGGNYHIDPDHPVVLDPPAFGQLPWTIGSGGGVPNGALVQAADAAVAALEVVITSWQPLAYAAPQVPGFLAEARECKGAVLELRQQAAAGAPRRTLRTLAAEVNRRQRSLNAAWGGVVASRVLPNLQLSDLDGANAALDQLDRY